MVNEESKEAGVASNEEYKMPFMDTFYSLASNDPGERSFAASSLLKHVFFQSGDDEDVRNIAIKDGAYAFTRLLKGLCSGRASARQGYASCLASFLKMSFEHGAEGDKNKVWVKYFMESMGKESIGSDEFIREQLTQHTSLEPAKGKKNSGGRTKSDDKDHQFGKLFGVLAIIRSGILASATTQVLNGYVTDLLSLYMQHQWFREPATHALKELFSCISATSGLDTVALMIQNVMPTFFNFGKGNTWTPEKICLYLHLQTLYMDEGETVLPEQLQMPVLTKSNMSCDIGGGIMKIILRDTSSTIYPRCNLVWPTIWSYLSEPNNEKGKKIKSSSIDRNLRKSSIIGDESPSTIIEGLVNLVIVENLLGEVPPNEGGIGMTYERRALALSLTQQLCTLNLPGEMLEKIVFQPDIVRVLFVDILQKGSSGRQNGRNKKNINTLKPLVHRILEEIVKSLCSATEENADKRLCVVRALLRGHPSFDSLSGVDTVSILLGFKGQGSQKNSLNEVVQMTQWEQYLKFLMSEVLTRLSSSTPAFNEAIKYIDILHSFMKRVMQISYEGEKEHLLKKGFTFLMVGAFFDLKSYENNDMTDDNENIAPVLSAANEIRAVVECIPYEVRTAMSSRYFSLLYDYLNSMSFQTADAKGHRKDKKIQLIIDELAFVEEGTTLIQGRGGLLINAGRQKEDESMDDDSPASIFRAIRSCEDMSDLEKNYTDDALTKKSIVGIRCLASCLALQLMHPGQPKLEGEEEHTNDEDEDLSDDILEIISDLREVASGIAGTADDKESLMGSGDESENPLSSLASICIGILSSSIGGGSLQSSVIRGGASKIVRDIVQIAWNSTLAIASSDSSSNVCLDSDVMSSLVEAVASPKALEQGEEEDEEMEEVDSDDDEDSNGGGNEDEDNALSFSKISAGMESDSSEDESEKDATSASADNKMDVVEEQQGAKEEIELDSSKLENLLLQDSDEDSVDADILEHHEGADAALAQLIKLKQEMRKGGQAKKEKIELSNRLRCLSLLESVFGSHKRSSLLSNQVVLMVILPLLRTRSELVKSVTSIAAERKENSTSQKKAILDKITSILENKVCKTQLDGMANIDACKTVGSQIMVEMKRVQNAAHCKCCSCLLALLVKAVGQQGDESITFAQSFYDSAVREWSTKRNTKLQAIMFDELVTRHQSVAKIVLVNPMIEASKEGRSAYIKAESFRILSALYNIQTPKDTDDNENQSAEEDIDQTSPSLQESIPAFAASLENALNDADSELMKAKRVRDVLKSVEKLVKFAGTCYGDEKVWDSVEKLGPPVQHLAESSGSNAVQTICKTLLNTINSGLELHKTKLAEEEEKKKKMIEEEQVVAPSSTSSGKKKKKKSKKKKGKK